MNGNENSHTIPKFTRGEKCIFFHLVLVFVAILILVIIFILHLYTVKHSKYTAINARRSGPNNGGSDVSYPQIGAVILNETDVVVCNSLLIKPKWSVSPANCIVARSHPDMANFLYSWRIVYKSYNNFATEIKSSIVHSHFDKDTLGYNIGLFEHVSNIPLDHYVLTNVPWTVGMHHFRIISNYKRRAGDNLIQQHNAKLFSVDKCTQYTSPILDLRNYEFCVVPQERTVSLEYGALVLLNEKVVGLYSWGERKLSHLPFVILNITFFHDWIHTMISFV
ncbi:uncharacterized protein LOC123705194 [Colias croceus]|uniref:uncharacterized protein LOC123705194 n=1 Tax=Colias crocea TaxID=72248 RepID=UPI001E28197A|nr:uncharacterized protein LOC123705194 [Colias croceus]